MATRKSSFDWTRIELEYLAGEDSIREIADRHAISEGAIRKRAKAEKWVRVVRRVRKVRTSTPPQPSPTVEREREPVPDAAAIAERGRGLVSRMLDELEATTTHAGELEEMIEEITADDRDGRRGAKTLKELATAFKTINEASAPQGKKAAAQDRAREVAGGSRFRPVGTPALSVVKT
jgi:hypothetical protein